MREDDRLHFSLDQKQGTTNTSLRQKTWRIAPTTRPEIDDAYLKGFDEETKDLLGVEPGDEGEKFLNIKNYISILKAKKVLLGYVKKWSEMT
ncbi:hypothetical protein [Candidatus Villigracilis affinis]|uniref:hypothetical protein n=1 Tax=Candidatus Villigracilis affinis TaxID=3140682 RepID=UPI001DE59A53|nr:hypothetical protein [Anaerolineales bacterium]